MSRFSSYLIACGISLANTCFAGGSFESFYGFTGAAPEAVAQSLASELSDAIAVTSVGAGYVLNFSGLILPAPLKAFLDHNFDVDATQRSIPVELSLAVYPADDGSELKLMVFNPDGARSEVVLPEKATVLLKESRAGACSAQLVLEHAEQLAQSDATWMAWLREQDFHVTPVRDASGTLFVGRRAKCAALVNIETDTDEPGNTLVVVRFSEE
jgi:hypothetical protein